MNGQIDKKTDRDLWELVHMGTEVKKSHSLPSARWRTSKPVVSFCLCQKAWEPALQGPKAGKDGHPTGRDRENVPFLYLFVPLGPQWNGGCSPPGVKVIFFTQSAESDANLLQDTLIYTPRNGVSPALWASIHPIKLTHKIKHHILWK